MKTTEAISPCMKGFLVTCFRNQESRAISEFYDFFNKVSENEISPEADNVASTDFETALSAEVKSMKSKKQNVLAIRNDIKGVVFIKVTSEVDVYATFDRLVFAVKEKVWKPKYIRRLLPVQTVVSASITELEKGLRKIEIDKDLHKTFSILIESRLNQTLSKKIVLDLAAQIIGQGMKVDLTSPSVCVFIEIIKNACCIGVVNNYYAMRKYNFVELYAEAVSPAHDSN